MVVLNVLKASSCLEATLATTQTITCLAITDLCWSNALEGYSEFPPIALRLFVMFSNLMSNCNSFFKYLDIFSVCPDALP